MELQITIESNTLSNTEIKQLLEAQPALSDYDIKLELRRMGVTYRGSLDPTVVVAIVGLTGPAIVALISGLLELVKQKNSDKVTAQASKIVFEAGDRRLEIPVNTRPEEIDQYIEKIKQMDADRIILP